MAFRHGTKKMGFSRSATRPADLVRSFSEFLRVDSGRARRCSKSHGSNQAGSGDCRTSRVGSGRVGSSVTLKPIYRREVTRTAKSPEKAFKLIVKG